MKKFIQIFIGLVILCGVIVSGSTSYAKSEKDKAINKDKITITVDPKSEGFEFSDGLYGTNHRYFDYGVGMWNAEEGAVYDEFQNMYEDSGLKSFRYPGGTTANYFWWKNSIGPVEDRKENINSYRGYRGEVPVFGLDEALTWAETNNQLITWVYNAANGNAQDAKELVYYLNATDGEWAELRAKNGHPEPYNVKHFEIGNELALSFIGSAFMSGEGIGDYAGATLVDRYAHGALMKYNNEMVGLNNDYESNAAISDGSENQEKFIKHGPAEEGEVSVSIGSATTSGRNTTFIPEEEWIQVTEAELNNAASDAKVYAIKDNQYILFGDGEHGAIPASGKYIAATYTAWHDGMQQYTDEMKAAAEDIGIDIKVYSSIEEDEFITIAKDIDYDGIVSHPYVLGAAFDVGPSVDSDDLLNFHNGSLIGFDASTQHVKNVQLLLDENKGVLNKDREVIVTEFTNRGSGVYNGSMSNTILTMDQVLSFFEMDLKFALRHSLIDNFWDGSMRASALYDAGPVDITTGTQTGEFLAQPSAYSYMLLDHMTGDYFLDSKIKNNPVISVDPSLVKGPAEEYDTNQLHSLASIDEDGNIYLIVINRDATEDAEVRVNIPGYQVSTVDVESLWHEDISAINTYENPSNIGIQNSTLTDIKGNGFDYEVPYTSMVGFKLNKAEKGNAK